MKYEPVIGLEVHVQLKTDTKIFCGCSTHFGSEPNTQVCPVCLGFPGVLPVLNRKVVEYAIKAALALNCEIATVCRFHRKNYFYPDLPKAYQISQYDEPIAKHGYIELSNNKKIGIARAHLEEDAGKLIHPGGGISFIDYNRAGTPLLEIVSKPEISSPQEAHEYLKILKSIMQYIEVSDCNMEEGSLRCDANVSVKPVESNILGVKTEIKNMNSFRAVEKALNYEIIRQIELLESGNEIVQETRLWDEEHQQTFPMRTKEEAHDYRYFPEPDLMPVYITEEWIKDIQTTIPELPVKKYKRFISQYNLPAYDAEILTSDKALAIFFEDTVKLFQQSKTVSNWIMTEVLSLLREAKINIEQAKITPEYLARMLKMIEDGIISGKIGKKIISEIFNTGKTPEDIVKEKGLTQISDRDELEKIALKVIQDNPKAVEQYRNGKKQALSFLIGQIMRITHGKAQPQLVNEILHEKLDNT
jgi:aspartyl-tRNA(Asn)/glutamyl-tRNA(Gln) amidotransferase subunit B